ncbi:MAG: hypothetical protein LBK26_03005 [Rickettsiales bacterium]|jgi:hypothetical protein|nr:hypothetical protein [Rickettsiales bacterium]
MPQTKYSHTERKEFLIALKSTKIGRDWLNSEERRALRPVKGLSANWMESYPLFYLEVRDNLYRLRNRTGYKYDQENIEKQSKLLNQFSKNNVEEGGKSVWFVAVVLCSDGDRLSNDTFTDGWNPVQNEKDKEANKNIAYFVEYADGTNSGWMLWDAHDFANNAVQDAINPLYYLATFSGYRLRVRDARTQCINARGRR